MKYPYYIKVLSLLLTLPLIAPNLAFAALSPATGSGSSQSDSGLFGPINTSQTIDTQTTNTQTTQSTGNGQTVSQQTTSNTSIPVPSVPKTSTPSSSGFMSVLSGIGSYLGDAVGNIFGFVGSAAKDVWNAVSGLFGGNATVPTLGQDIVFDTPSTDLGGLSASDFTDASGFATEGFGDSTTGVDIGTGAGSADISSLGDYGLDAPSLGVESLGNYGLDAPTLGVDSLGDYGLDAPSLGIESLGDYGLDAPGSLLDTGLTGTDFIGSGIGGGGNNVPVDVINLAKPTMGILRSTASTANSTKKLEIKEFIQDPILYAIVKVIVQSVTTSIIRWANNGFHGNPSFVTDVNGFLRDVGDQAFGQFLQDQGLSYLCSAFSRPVIKGLQFRFQEPFQQRVSCTLTSLVNSASGFLAGNTGYTKTVNVNVENFIGGDWYSGGWSGWYGMVSEQQNNPYGAYLITEAEASQRILDAQDAKAKELSYGNGYLSYERCIDTARNAPSGGGYYEDIGAPSSPSAHCEIVTPGSVIKEQVNSAIGAPLRQLENADEINELISALAVGLIPEILGGINGLRGVSTPNYGSSNSYLDAYNNSNQLTGTTKQNALDTVAGTLRDESDYRSAFENAVGVLDNTQVQLQTLHSCWQGKTGLATLTPPQLAEAQTNLIAVSTTLASEIPPRKQVAQTQIAAADKNIATLITIGDQMSQAQTAPELQGPSQAYQSLLAQNAFHDPADIVDATTFRDNVQNSMSTLSDQTSQKQAECSLFPPPPPEVIPSF